MCSRFSFKVTEEELRNLFGDPRLDGFRVERIDWVSPGEWIVIVKPDQGERVVELADWGFIPSYYKDPKQGPVPTCIRGETIDTSPMFKKAFKKGRCIIPVRGFYEYMMVPGQKRKLPVFFPAADGEVLGLAGLVSQYDRPEGWKPKEYKEGETPKAAYIVDLDRAGSLLTAGIVTVEPNELVGEVHNRMPAILPRTSWDEWLDPKNEDTVGLKKLIRTAANDILIAEIQQPKPLDPKQKIPAARPVPSSDQPSLFGSDESES